MIHFKVPSKGFGTSYTKEKPKQGEWFSVVYLSDNTPEDDEIKLQTKVRMAGEMQFILYVVLMSNH